MTDQQAPPTRRALSLDVAKYQAYLDDTSIPDHRKKEMIDALWGIVVAFVDLGYQVSAEDANAEECCGKPQVQGAQTAPDRVESAGTLKHTGGTRDA